MPPWKRKRSRSSRSNDSSDSEDSIDSGDSSSSQPISISKEANSWRQWQSAFEASITDLEDQLQSALRAVSSERKQREKAEKDLARLQELWNKVSKENGKLKAELQMQKGISSVVLSHGACWQYQMNGTWHALPPEGNDKMHEAYLAFLRKIPDSRHATITSGGVARQVDFQEMQQRHVSTQRVRPIRILPGVPSQWVTKTEDLLQQGNDLQAFYVEVKDRKIHDAIQKVLQSTGHAHDFSTPCSLMRIASIKSVHRIENFRLWHRYRARLAAMRQDHAVNNISVKPAAIDLDGTGQIMTISQSILDCGEALAADLDEKILLHGTSYGNADAIVQDGFDNRASNCFSMYGAGVYFSCAACKSHQYTCEVHRGGCNCEVERTLIIARVALGDASLATETRYEERRPPERSAGGTYDSIVVHPGQIKGHHKHRQVHQEYVVFDREQAYPCYVVQYIVKSLKKRRKGGCFWGMAAALWL